MRKWIALILAGVMALSLFGCAGKEEDKTALKPNVTRTEEGKVEFTLLKITTGELLTPTMGSNFYFRNEDESETYVDALFVLKNLSAEAVTPDKTLTFAAIGAEGKEYGGAVYAFEEDEMRALSTDRTLAPGDSARLHAAVRVPKTEKELTLQISAGETVYKTQYTLGSAIREAQKVTAGERVELPGEGAFVFRGIRYAEKLLPEQVGEAYFSYQVENPDVSTYLIAEVELTNLQSEAKIADSFIAASVTGNGVEYQGMAVLSSEDKIGFAYMNSTELAPAETRLVSFAFEVPKSLAGSEATVDFSFLGREYTFTGAES